MISLFKSVFTRNPFSAKEPKKLLLLGLDASGKTTFLYQIKNRADEVDTLIPTIGFNVESIELQNLAFKCWDIGGCDKLRSLWRHYMTDVSAVIFMVDSNDFDRMDSVKEEMTTILSELDKGVPLLVVNNKIDLPNSRSIEQVFRALGLHEMQDRRWEIIPCCAIDKARCKDCLDWIHDTLCDSKKHGSRMRNGLSSEDFFKAENERREKLLLENKQTNSEVIRFRDPVQEEVEKHNQRKFDSVWKDWVHRAEQILMKEETSDEDLFLAQFQEADLPSWDHYTHVRLAYIVIKRKGIEQGFREVEDGINHYIQTNQVQTNGKSFHPTMTRFWCHMVAFWLLQYSKALFSKRDTEGTDKSDFWNYLVFVHDHKDNMTDLAQGGLFRQYYSTEVIFGPIAKSSIVDPDLQPLPAIAKLSSYP